MCALAALISGEQHPLLNVLAEHSVALLTVVKAMIENLDGAETPPQPDGPPPDGQPPPDPAGPTEPGHYQRITVIVEE